MKQKISSVLVVLYLLVAFVDYLDREGVKKGLWDNILWRDGGLPVISLAKGLLWPKRFVTTQDTPHKELMVRAKGSASDQLAATSTEIDFIGQVCAQGFAGTSMPRSEVTRFCKCVQDDINPQLTDQQRISIREAQAIMARGQPISEGFFVASGVRDLVIAGQARCEAAFYPPSQPISFRSGSLMMTLRCNDETQGPEVFIYIQDGRLLTKREHDNVAERMIKGDFGGEFANVKLQFDAAPSRDERWQIDLTGQMVSPSNPHIVITELRGASFLKVDISRGKFHYSGRFSIDNSIPPRWVPCGGVPTK